MYSVLNRLPKYTYFYISKNITSDTFYLVFKIVESLMVTYTGEILNGKLFLCRVI